MATEKKTAEQWEAENAALRAELAEAKTANVRGLKFKVADKGGVSVYGLGRFPVTLYREQWTTLFDAAPRVLGFIEENKASLKSKADKAFKKAA